MSDEVDTILFGFLRAMSFWARQEGVEPDFPATARAIRRHSALRSETVLGWSPEMRAGLGEFLAMWFTMDRLMAETGSPLVYPPGFCEGSSPTRLGLPFLEYIASRSNEFESIYLHGKQAAPGR